MSPSLPQSQSRCSTIQVPGQFLQEMTRIGQGGLDDWSSHFLQTYNQNQTYQSQSRKLNVLAAITDVVSRNVLFLRKFYVPGIQTPAVDLLLPPARGCGSRLSSVWTPTSSSQNVLEKPPKRSKKSFARAVEKEEVQSQILPRMVAGVHLAHGSSSENQNCEEWGFMDCALIGG